MNTANKTQEQSFRVEAERAFQLLRQDESSGLDGFFELHYPALMFLAVRLLNNAQDAEDLAVDAFIRLWHKRQEFNSAAEAKTFLFKIVLKGCQSKANHSQKLQPKVHDPLFKALVETLVADRLVNVEDALKQLS
jgi:DNA-directed RNA polymerase specialized sigma24 family protein